MKKRSDRHDDVVVLARYESQRLMRGDTALNIAQARVLAQAFEILEAELTELQKRVQAFADALTVLVEVPA